MTTIYVSAIWITNYLYSTKMKIPNEKSIFLRFIFTSNGPDMSRGFSIIKKILPVQIGQIYYSFLASPTDIHYCPSEQVIFSY